MARGGRKPARGRGGDGVVGVQAAARAALASDNSRTIPTTYNDTAKRDINPGDTFLCLFSEDSKLRLFCFSPLLCVSHLEFCLSFSLMDASSHMWMTSDMTTHVPCSPTLPVFPFTDPVQVLKWRLSRSGTEKEWFIHWTECECFPKQVHRRMHATDKQENLTTCVSIPLFSEHRQQTP